MRAFRAAAAILALLVLPPPGVRAQTVDFDNDVQPILTRYGCNSGACHGKARGQGGFQLSLLGFDSEFDFAAVTRESRGRRIFAPVPKRSLLLQKPTGQVPHGGGIRLPANSPEYKMILRWIEEGLPRRAKDAPNLTHVTVEPAHLTLKNAEQIPLKVTAHYDNNARRDVTRLAAFQSNEAPIAKVNEHGVVTGGRITGTAAAMARFGSQIAVCDITVPRPEPIPAETYARLPRRNFIDELVWKKLQRLNITPSELCSDHAYLRRATTDICGRIPRADEVAEFLNDSADDKREALVNRLLSEPDFADHWANKWMDLLRPNPYRVGIKAVMNYDQWIRQRFHQRLPWDQFVRELITARGSTFRNGAVTLFRDRRTPDEVTTLVSQLFVGVRLECAKCHHHPFEKWGQDDFYSFAAYFAKIGRKGRGVSPPISGSEEFFYAGKSGSVKHPVTQAVMPPRPLWGKADVTDDLIDPREALAKWITSTDNQLFAQVMANRVWADLMGRGLVEPVDDFRATNPPTNAPLLKSLGEHFRDSGFSLTELVRAVATSHVYQLSSLPNDNNIADTRNYSRHYRHRLRAEVLLDAFAEVTGIPQSFDAMPPGTNAKQIWTHRTASLFLDTFGRPDPNQDPPCERVPDSTVVQSLHLMNAKQLHADLLNKNSRITMLANSESTPEDVAQDIYRIIYGRQPSANERQLVVDLLQENAGERLQAIQDLAWAMLNTPEFVFQN